MSDLNPVDFGEILVENPIITRLDNDVSRLLIKKNYTASIMKKIISCLKTSIFIMVALSCSQHQFYISPSGDDQNNGTRDQPWQTIEKINSTDLKPGDQVLFEGGSTFYGTIRLTGEDQGDKNNKVVITSFGEGKATINGGNKEGLVAIGTHHLLIRELIFRGNGRKDGNETNGIHIVESDTIEIDQVEVYGFQHSGLLVHKATDVKITRVYAHNNGFAGIHVTGTTMNDPVNYDNNNIYIGYSTAENNPGDPIVEKNHSGNGILASSVRGGIIEYCRAFNNGWDMEWTGNGPVGIWIWDCTDFIIQYCISHDNKTNPVAKDGGGFDFDGGVSNSILQYCVSYNNQGPGIGLFEFGAAKTWENNIIRYNISINDGIINPGSLAVWKNEARGTMRNCEIYNNTFYNDTPKGVSLWFYNNWPGFNFRNNIFVYRDSFIYPGQKLESELFQGNCYWSLNGDMSLAGYKSLLEWARSTENEIISDTLAGIYSDPMFVSPGTISLTDPRKITAETLSEYALKPGSPLINRGLDMKRIFMINPGLSDITGTPIPQGEGYEPGALEYIMK
jgi:hypothetical protein